METEDDIVKLDMKNKADLDSQRIWARTIVLVVALLSATVVSCHWVPDNPAVLWRCVP